MKRLLPVLAVTLFLLLGVTTMGVAVVEGGDTPFQYPLVYDWINNNSSDSGSYVSNYSIQSPHQYFSGGLDGPQNIEDRLNNSSGSSSSSSGSNGDAIYRVYDDTFEVYPTDDVYDKWNDGNPYDYNQREYIPEFKKNEPKNTTGNNVDVGFGQKTIRDGWVGIYSIEPSTYAYYKPPDENDDSDYYDVSHHLTDDTISVSAVTNSNMGSLPDTEQPLTNSDGAIRRQYSFDRIDREATLYVNRTDDCSSKCTVATDTNMNHVAEFNEVDISSYVDKGEDYEIIVKTTHYIVYDVDIDEQERHREEIDCPANRESPCYNYYYDWHDLRTTESSHSMTTNDSQNVTVAGGLNRDEETVNDEIEYERGVYPNGTTTIYLNTTSMDGFETDDPVWRRIEVANEYIQSPWRGWSSQNSSWKFMYPDSDSDEPAYSGCSNTYNNCYSSTSNNERHQSHTRPLAFHTAPVEEGLETSSSRISYRQTEQEINPISGIGFGGVTYTEQSYDSPKLIRSKFCKSEYPEHNNQPEDVYCGWWITGAGNDITQSSEVPYLTIDNDGDWQTYNQLFITVPNSAYDSETITMYGLLPDSSVEIESDRTVEIQPTELYVERIDDNIGESGENEDAWVEVRLTLLNSETNERISTQDETQNYIQVENANPTGNGEYEPEVVDTNESGQVTVRVYDVKQSGINAQFNSKNWTEVDENETAYAPSDLDDSVPINALPLSEFLRYLIGMLGFFYIILSISVYFLNVIQIETTVKQEWQKFFPDDFYKIILWTIVLYFVLSLL